MQNRVVVGDVRALEVEGKRGGVKMAKGGRRVRFRFEVWTGMSPFCSFVSPALTLCLSSSAMRDSSVVYQPKSL